MPEVSIYLPMEMFLRLKKAGNTSKTVQEALNLLWTTRAKKKNRQLDVEKDETGKLDVGETVEGRLVGKDVDETGAGSSVEK